MFLAAVPASIAVTLKFWLLWRYKKTFISNNLADQKLRNFLIALGLHNVCEIVVYTSSSPELRFLFMDFYYAISVVALALGARFTATSIDSRITEVITALLMYFALFVGCLFLFSDVMVHGYQPAGHALTKIEGPLYPLFSISALLSCLAMVFTLAYGIRNNTGVERVRSIIMMCGLLFLILSVVMVIFLQILEINITAGAIVPISTTIFLWVLAHTSNRTKLFDPRTVLPFFEENKKRNFATEILHVSDDPINLSEKVNEFKLIMIKDALKRFNGDKNAAAEYLGFKSSGSIYYYLNEIEKALGKNQKADHGSETMDKYLKGNQ